MADLVTRTIFAGLVQRLGGVDAAAAVLEARFGVGCKGTVSRWCAGHSGVTLDAVVALEDALGSYPLTRRLAERIAAPVPARADMQALTAESSVASGQAHAALIRAMSALSPGGAEITAEEGAEALPDLRAARDALARIVDALEAGARAGVDGRRAVPLRGVIS